MDEFDPIGQLLKNLESPEESEREESILELANFLDNPRIVKGLVETLNDQSRYIHDLVVNILGRESNPLVLEALIPYLSHKNFYIRNSAISILKKIGGDQIQLILDLMPDTQEESLLFLIEILNSFKNPEIAPFLHSLLQHENPNIVFAALDGLISLQLHESIPHLIAIMDQNEEPALKIAAIHAIGKIGDPGACPKLRFYLDDPDLTIVLAAIEALGNLGDQESVPKMVQLYPDAPSLIQEMIIIAVKQIGDSCRIDFLRDFDPAEVKIQLNNALNEDDLQIKFQALDAIQNVFDEDFFDRILPYLSHSDLELKIRSILLRNSSISFPLIEKLLTGDQELDNDMIIQLMSLLAEGNYVRNPVVFLKYYRHPEFILRAETAYHIGKTMDPVCESMLKELLQDEVGHVRRAALTAIGWGNYTPLIQDIIPLMKDPFPDVQEAAIGALVLIGNDSVIERLVELLKQDDPEDRIYSIKALSWIGRKEVIPYLEDCLKSPQKELRKISIESLARMHSKDSAPLLLDCLYDEDPQNRQASVQALVDLGYPQAYTHIINLLNDNNMWVRYVAAKNLIHFDRDHAREPLSQILSGTDEISILGALQSLFEFRVPECLPQIRQLTQHANYDIVDNAQRVLNKYTQEE
ncbi:MAG: HEAT repeat domain-containing protein [Candidatus Delongbacteria bacterium]|nr:HEAT repeat domain-containing protein [Candidatus Delongbacteria bacterium]